MRRLRILVLGILLSVCMCKLSEFDLKQIDIAWSNKEVKDILIHLKKMKKSLLGFESLQFLEEQRELLIQKESTNHAQIEEVQSVCEKKSMSFSEEIDNLRAQKGIEDSYLNQNRQIETFLHQLLSEHYQMQTSTQELLQSIQEQKQELQVALLDKLESSKKEKSELQSIITILTQILDLLPKISKESPLKSNADDLTKLLGEYTRLVSSMPNKDYLRIFYEGFNKDLMKIDSSHVEDIIKMTNIILKNNESEQQFTEASNVVLLNNVQEQVDILNVSAQSTQQEINNIVELLHNFSDIFTSNDDLTISPDLESSSPQELTIQSLSSSKNTFENECNQQIQNMSNQLSSLKNRKHFTDLLIQYIKLDQQGTLEKISQLK